MLLLWTKVGHHGLSSSGGSVTLSEMIPISIEEHMSLAWISSIPEPSEQLQASVLLSFLAVPCNQGNGSLPECVFGIALSAATVWSRSPRIPCGLVFSVCVASLNRRGLRAFLPSGLLSVL